MLTSEGDVRSSILLIGGSGYVGGRLIPRLEQHPQRQRSRRPRATWGSLESENEPASGRQFGMVRILTRLRLRPTSLATIDDDHSG